MERLVAMPLGGESRTGGRVDHQRLAEDQIGKEDRSDRQQQEPNHGEFETQVGDGLAHAAPLFPNIKVC